MYKKIIIKTDLTVLLSPLKPTPHPTSYCLGSGPWSGGGIRCEEEEEQEEVGVEWISIWRGWGEVENVEWDASVWEYGDEGEKLTAGDRKRNRIQRL